jgi:hypothetical protein
MVPRHLKLDVKADRVTPAYLIQGCLDLPMSDSRLGSTKHEDMALAR